MRASALKYAILSVMATMAMLIIFLMPFHAPLTVWGASILGHYTALRLWKEVLLLFCFLGLMYLLVTDQKIRGSTMTRLLVWLILAYSFVTIGWGAVTYHWHDVSLKALGYGLIVDLRYPVFFLITWAIASRTNRLRAQWQRLVLWPAYVVIVFGLLQVYVLPHNFLLHFGYGVSTILPFETINNNTNFIRIESTLRGANPLGAYLLIPISLLTVSILRGNRAWHNIFFLGAALLTLFFTFSRSAWVGAAISIGIIIIISVRNVRARRLLLMTAGVVFVLVGGLLIGFRHSTVFQNLLYHTQNHSAVRTTSDQNHASALKLGLHDLVHDPLGRGPGSAGPASVYNNHPPRIAENFYIQIGQEVGWLGLALYLLINAGVGYLLWLRRDDPLALCLLASLVGLSFINLLSHAWADDTLAYVWWGLAGIAMAPHIKPKERH